MKYPPVNPTKSQTTVRTGIITNIAQKRGTASLRIGSMPNARRASICSDDFIEPISAVIPAATRAATIKPVSTGPSSRTIAITITRPR